MAEVTGYRRGRGGWGRNLSIHCGTLRAGPFAYGRRSHVAVAHGWPASLTVRGLARCAAVCVVPQGLYRTAVAAGTGPAWASYAGDPGNGNGPKAIVIGDPGGDGPGPTAVIIPGGGPPR